MGPPSCMQSVIDRNIVMRHMTVVSGLLGCDTMQTGRWVPAFCRKWRWKCHVSLRHWYPDCMVSTHKTIARSVMTRFRCRKGYSLQKWQW